ncbi:hypothetical protein [Lentibacillus salicampi]|uniref:Uncharacterized protein n=1 Tax=Lentibacillus salicampi TaxID=175306 RepID=A0A4Y9A7E9_9BACI|nr:hypothetical protein [Lentibacillus salicampi]TFJ91375.1 hypothetical protein E4U82_18090 [Lentibacillus salicampi]
MKEILTNLSFVSVILTSISSIAAVLTVYFSYKAIKVNRELFDQNKKAEEQRLLPLFDIDRNYKRLDETGTFIENPNPDEIATVSFVNINSSPIANIRLTDGVVFNNNTDTEPLLTSKYIRAYNFGTKGIMVQLIKEELKEKKFKINIKYSIQTNKTYMTEIIILVSNFKDVFYFTIEEQNHINV